MFNVKHLLFHLHDSPIIHLANKIITQLALQ